MVEPFAVSVPLLFSSSEEEKEKEKEKETKAHGLLLFFFLSTLVQGRGKRRVTITSLKEEVEGTAPPHRQPRFGSRVPSEPC